MSTAIDIKSETYDFSKQLNILCSTMNIGYNVENYENIENIKKSILNKCDSISDSLESYHVCVQEFLDFLEIYDMIEDVFGNDKYLNVECLLFLNIVIGDFIKIMEKRYEITNANTIDVENIPKNELDEYMEEFEKYDDRFFKLTDEFHTNITPLSSDETSDVVDFIYKLIEDSYFRIQ